jgi:hypothetical protein
MGRRRLRSSQHSDLVTDFCEQGNETFSSIKGEEFLY